MGKPKSTVRVSQKAIEEAREEYVPQRQWTTMIKRVRKALAELKASGAKRGPGSLILRLICVDYWYERSNGKIDLRDRLLYDQMDKYTKEAAHALR